MRGKLLNAFTHGANWSVTSRVDKSIGLYAQAPPGQEVPTIGYDPSREELRGAAPGACKGSR